MTVQPAVTARGYAMFMAAPNNESIATFVPSATRMPGTRIGNALA